MATRLPWPDLATGQLVRYEALFRLLDDIRQLEDVPAIAGRAATQWKYFASVGGWRLVVATEPGFVAIDGERGEARVTPLDALPAWDEHHWRERRPALLDVSAAGPGSALPPHLAGPDTVQVAVLPLQRGGRAIALLAAAARHAPFTDLDHKFIRLAGSQLADRVADILLRRRALAALVEQATHDSLTGLANRAAILERLSRQAATARRTGSPLAVLIADIDHFKAVNDQHGHLAGDEVLREVASRLSLAMRDADSLGRLGGEEFLGVLYPCGEEDALQAAERLRQAVARSPVCLATGPAPCLAVTVSLGVASGAAGGEATTADLLRRADEALYRAKAGGRNRVSAGP